MMAEFVEERFVWVTDHQDFVQSHVKPVHSNLFFLISSYMKTSCPNGLLPEKQKVGGKSILLLSTFWVPNQVLYL